MKIIYAIIIAIVLLLLTYIFLKFNKPNIFVENNYATIILDKNEDIIASRASKDKQWRFKNTDTILSNYYKNCLIVYEDKRFYNHLGVDFCAIARAAQVNFKANKIKSGASTITMQLARLLKKRKGKSYFDKCVEIGLALWIEIAYTKNEILLAYTQLAPFGGNIVGIEAASWKYFGKKMLNLTWAEAALLAILPNNPAKLFPGKNNNILLLKRNALLHKIAFQKIITDTDYENAILEPLPTSIKVFENHAPHALDYLLKSNKNSIISTTLSKYLQVEINKILLKKQNTLRGIGVYNAAVLVLDVKQNSVLAYIGNMPKISNNYQNHVDIIQAPRSTGSILKPLLFAMNISDGKLLSTALVADIPTIIAGYAPKNYNSSYDGAVPFCNALHRSLNVPAVRVLKEYGIEKFHHNLIKLGITTLSKPASHYGLTMILGGAEATLWDVCQIYARMARSLQTFNQYNSYEKSDFEPSKIYKINNEKEVNKSQYFKDNLLSAGAIWQTFEAMNEVARPDQEEGWKLFSYNKIAWKTGTSFGNRDAWAVGCTPEYIVGIWAGNADGEGRVELTGIKSAAPIMFDVFNILKNKTWFEMPQNDILEAEICKKSGFIKSNYCSEITKSYICKAGQNTPICMYCKEIFTDKSGKFRVNSSCMNVSEMIRKNQFSLPPAMEYYYKSNHADYLLLPNPKNGCENENKSNVIDIIYPQPNAKIFIPTEINENKGKVIFQAAFKGVGKLYWHIDTDFISETDEFHQLSVSPKIGKHTLTVQDGQGNYTKVVFEVIK